MWLKSLPPCLFVFLMGKILCMKHLYVRMYPHAACVTYYLQKHHIHIYPFFYLQELWPMCKLNLNKSFRTHLMLLAKKTNQQIAIDMLLTSFPKQLVSHAVPPDRARNLPTLRTLFIITCSTYIHACVFIIINGTEQSKEGMHIWSTVIEIHGRAGIWTQISPIQL